MTNHPNETPEPLAGPSVESCATALAEALRREKGWLLDYADSVIRDAIDRKHLEPLAQEQAGEMPKPWQCFQHNSGWNTWENVVPSARYEAGVVAAYTAQQMRDYRTAAIQAKDAEIAGLKADAGRYRWLLANKRLIKKVVLELGYGFGAALQGAEYVNEVLDEARELGKDAWGVPLVDAAAIRAQTGGEHG